ncbi:hypothetical protein NSTC745_03691 [Nostoc sp. DSM 114161]|jgi:hypothetical protein|uniref:hypothetical protein n=1 Tax=Nostoc sp. DSM 114161 TaxID=3440143 RepID=UPI0040467423
MLKRILKDVIQFLGLMSLLGIGTFGFYMAMVAYQLCQLDRQCPLYQFQQPQLTSLEYQQPKIPSE